MQGDYLIFAMCGPRSLYSSAHREPVNIPPIEKQSVFESAKKVDIFREFKRNCQYSNI